VAKNLSVGAAYERRLTLRTGPRRASVAVAERPEAAIGQGRLPGSIKALSVSRSFSTRNAFTSGRTAPAIPDTESGPRLPAGRSGIGQPWPTRGAVAGDHVEAAVHDQRGRRDGTERAAQSKLPATRRYSIEWSACCARLRRTGGRNCAAARPRGGVAKNRPAPALSLASRWQWHPPAHGSRRADRCERELQSALRSAHPSELAQRIDDGARAMRIVVARAYIRVHELRCSRRGLRRFMVGTRACSPARGGLCVVRSDSGPRRWLWHRCAHERARHPARTHAVTAVDPSEPFVAATRERHSGSTSADRQPSTCRSRTPRSTPPGTLVVPS